MELAKYLISKGIVTGPLVKNTSHSGLGVIKTFLIGDKQFAGGESFLIFGNSLHHRALVKFDEVLKTLTQQEQNKMEAMLKAFQQHPVCQKLMKGSIREQKLYTEIKGVVMAFILDIHQKKLYTGADIKTTSCPTLEKFIEKAIEYGYFRQAQTYIIAAELDHFYFIGITKSETPKIFILYVQDYPEELHYAEKELEFLTYFYKRYGKCVLPGDPASLPLLQSLDKNHKDGNNPRPQKASQASKQGTKRSTKGNR